MVRPIKFDCWSRLRRTRTRRSTFKRPRNQFTADRESNLTVIRANIKNENHHRDAAVECQL
jgi:hypothetical protein